MVFHDYRKIYLNNGMWMSQIDGVNRIYYLYEYVLWMCNILYQKSAKLKISNDD